MNVVFGYMLPGIAESGVDWFNLHEKACVGLRIPKTFELTNNGRIVSIGTELVKGSLQKGNYRHFPSFRVPDSGIAIFGPRRFGNGQRPSGT